MKKITLTGLILFAWMVISPGISMAEERPSAKGIGPANFYISLKDKIGLSQEQENNLNTIEKEAIQKLGEISAAISKTQNALNQATREEEVDLKKVREMLMFMATLEANGKYIVIESMTLENKVLTKDQRDKAREIALGMSKGNQAPPPPPEK